MVSGKLIIRNISIPSLVFQLLLIAALVFVISLFVKFLPMAFFLSAILYSSIAMSLRNTNSRNHREGVKLVKNAEYNHAIIEHKKSYEFFLKHPLIDKYRFITMLSVTRMSYSEMDLICIAYCCSKIGSGVLSKQYYEKALMRFPKSEMANNALELIKSVENLIEIYEDEGYPYNFGGVYFENGECVFLVTVITSEIKSLFDNIDIDKEKFRLKECKYSYKQLIQVSNCIELDFSTKVGIYSWEISHILNCVVIYVDETELDTLSDYFDEKYGDMVHVKVGAAVEDI
jgi:hypothetical protein